MSRPLPRTLDLRALLEKRSHFLFGARATGKSSLIRSQLDPSVPVIDLLRGDVFLRLSANPSELEGMLDAASGQQVVVIDEVQKVPALLDEVHRLIEQRHWRFLLTGSSARKLKHGGANLLAGRARTANLFPLTFHELANAGKFALDHHLRWGGLPLVALSDEPHEDLTAYVDTYVREEVIAEGIIRKLPPFARFLKTAALANGQLINYTALGSDAQVSPSTIRQYVSVLEDTLVAFQLEPFTETTQRKAISTAKLYFFDTGVTHALAQTRAIDRNSNLYGAAFEQFIAIELRAYLSYRRSDAALRYWRSTHQQEVDFVVGRTLAIEVKATTNATDRDARHLRAFQEERLVEQAIVVSHDRIERRAGGVIFLPWDVFLQRLWDDTWTIN